MSATMLRRGIWAALLASVGIAGGCGDAKTPATDAASSTSNEAGQLPTASISSPKSQANPGDEEEDEDDPAEVAEDLATPKVEPKEGTPEWLVREATRLRLEPPPETEDVEELKKHRKQRNEKIIKLCQEVISKTHSDKEKERVFNFAVHNMLEARLQLAITGEREPIDALYEDAAALFERAPESAAAAEGAHTLVNLAYSRAKYGTGDNNQWVQEFARQAAHYAQNFPAEERRSLPLLFTAARSCEVAGLTKDAIEAYSIFEQKFPASQYTPRVAAVLRRLKLPGNPPQLSGPTLEGDQVVLDDLLGKVVLVVFWSSEAKPFVEKLPDLMETTRAHTKQGLHVVGVNLDQDVTTANQFIVKNKLGWPQIFFTEDGKQGWNNPIAVYYGVLDIPAFWLIDQSGNVVSTTLTVDKLGAEVGRLLAAGEARPAGEAATEDAAAEAKESKDSTEEKKPHLLERPRKSAKKPAARVEEE